MAVGAEACLNIKGLLLGGLVGHDLYQAGRGITTKQRALWPSQDFNTLDVHQVQQTALRATEINAVNVDADFGVLGCRPVDLADAANEDLSRRIIDSASRNIRVRAKALYLCYIPDVASL